MLAFTAASTFPNLQRKTERDAFSFPQQREEEGKEHLKIGELMVSKGTLSRLSGMYLKEKTFVNKASCLREEKKTN